MKFSSLNYGQQYNSRSRMMELLLLQLQEPTTNYSVFCVFSNMELHCQQVVMVTSSGRNVLLPSKAYIKLR